MKTTDKSDNPKFYIGDVVKPDTLIHNLKIVDYWWTDKAYGSKTGDYVYRMAFMTKSGDIDKRRNYRQFEQSRLTLIKSVSSQSNG